MLVVGLVHDRPWEPPPEPPRPRPRRSWSVPWRGLAWLGALCALMAVVPVAAHVFGGLAGYGLLLLAITLGAWRLDRWCGRLYWRGLGEHRE